MIAGQLREQTRELLDETIPEKKDLDDKVRQLIEAEYLRQLGRHKRTNSALTDKYGMTFEEFVARRVARQRDIHGRWSRTPWLGRLLSAV